MASMGLTPGRSESKMPLGYPLGCSLMRRIPRCMPRGHFLRSNRPQQGRKIALSILLNGGEVEVE